MDESKTNGIQDKSCETKSRIPDKIKEEKKQNFLIGADPEFALTSQGRKIDARQTLQYLLRGKKEFREMPDNGRDRKIGILDTSRVYTRIVISKLTTQVFVGDAIQNDRQRKRKIETVVHG